MEPAFVLDASVALAWCFEDEANAYADQALDRLSEASALVPVIWPLEVGNALLGAERRGRLSEAEATRSLELLGQLPIHAARSSSDTPDVVLALARQQGLSTYDAAYLDLAMRLGLPLATLDEALRSAALRCGVRLFGGEGQATPAG